MEFRIGEVLASSWRVLSRHFLTFLLLVGTVDLFPLALRLYWEPAHLPPVGTGRRILIVGGLILPLEMAFGSIGYAIVTLAVFQGLRGKPVGALDSVRHVGGHLFPVLLASVLSGMAFIFGLFFCLVPGLYVTAAWSVVLPACVVERRSVFASFSRSTALTAGHRWPILGVGVAWTFGVPLINWMLRRIAPAAALPTELLAWLWGALSGSFASVYAAVLYYRLRAVREGIGIEQIAAVFE